MSSVAAPARSALRASLFAGTLAEISATYHLRRVRTLEEKAHWLQYSAQRILRRIGVRVSAHAAPPSEGLLVSNHLSYLDVLVYASLVPAVFVSKREVEAWPVFGRLATMAGTIYVDRERRPERENATDRIENALLAGLPVVLFPEGTSSDGRELLPFHSPYFEPAMRTGSSVTAAAITYSSESATEPELAYYGADVFGPHLFRTLGQRGMHASVRFSQPAFFRNRKEAARWAEHEICQMRATEAQQQASVHDEERYRLVPAG